MRGQAFDFVQTEKQLWFLCHPTSNMAVFILKDIKKDNKIVNIKLKLTLVNYSTALSTNNIVRPACRKDELNTNKQNIIFFNLNSTYTFCVDGVCGKQEGSKQRGLGSVVQYPTILIMGQSTNQYSKHVNHEGRYDSMEDDVQHMEANRVQASRQEVVQPARAREGNT